MNYNQGPGVTGMRSPQGPTARRMKHVGDVNSLGMPSAPMPNVSPIIPDAVQQPPMFNNMPTNAGFNTNYSMPPQQQQPQQQHQQQPQQPQMNTSTPYNNVGGMPPVNMNQNYAAYANTFQGGVGVGVGGPTQYRGDAMQPNDGQVYGQANVPPQFSMFQQPMVQDMAMQYGQRLADQGKQMVEHQLERWVSVSQLKYYFAVDNRYVINKLRLLLFPFTHRDWSLKYDQEKPVQPRYDINAPDLYIPTMAYITYVVVAGLMLGLQNRFSPEQLGIQASSALACSIFELLVYTITLYISNIKTNLKTLDLVAFTGYKFVIIVSSLIASAFFHGIGYYLTLLYCSLSLGFFLLRTLRTKVLQDSAPAPTANAINYDPYGNPQQLDYRGGRKRKLYFLFLIVGGQAFFSFLLTKHLYFSDALQLDKPPLGTL